MSEMISHTDCEKFFDDVLKLDEKIRYAAIYDGGYHARFREGVQGYYKEDEIKSSLAEAQQRWATRKKNTLQIGQPKFSMTQFSKVNRITFPLCNGGVILVTTDLGIDITKLVDSVIEVCQPIEDHILHGFYTR